MESEIRFFNKKSALEGNREEKNSSHQKNHKRANFMKGFSVSMLNEK